MDFVSPDAIASIVEGVLAARTDKLRAGAAPIVGYLPGGYVPEELIYASGAIPLCLSHGGDARPAEEALPILPNVMCPFVRAQLGELRLQTNPFYQGLDLLVVPSTCQHMKKLGDIQEYLGSVPVFKLGVPYEHEDDFELAYYRDRLAALKARLEVLTGHAIGDESLREAINVYNRMRELLTDLSSKRRSRPPAISALDFVRLNHASMYADPVAMVEALEEVAGGLASPVDAVGANRPRVLLMGPNVAFGDYDLLRMAAEAGAEIVVEDIFEGVRDHRHHVDATGDPLEAIARGYLLGKRPPTFMRGSTRRRLDFALELVSDLEISGVLWYQLLCCEFYDQESYFFQRAFGERDIPMLIVESDYRGLEAGPLRTRLEAFVETMAGGLIDA